MSLCLSGESGETELTTDTDGGYDVGYASDGNYAVYKKVDFGTGVIGVTARLDVFDTRNRGSDVGDEYNDAGWAAMLAAKRDWGHLTGLVELLHVSSRRDNRLDAGLTPRQRQDQLQAEVRMHW